MPQLIYDGLQQMRRLEDTQRSLVELRSEEFRHDARRGRRSLVLGGFLILLAAMTTQPEVRSALDSMPWYGWLFSLAGVAALWRA
jgi:ubiquinone biosynthesis protein